MSDLHSLKKRILLDIKQRARASTHSANADTKCTLSVENSSLRGSRTSLKLPKSPRIGSKRFNIPAVFKSSTKDHLLGNKHDTDCEDRKTPSKNFIQEEDLSKTILAKPKSGSYIFTEIENTYSRKSSDNRSQSAENLLSLPGDTKTSTKKTLTKSIKSHWDRSIFTNRKKNKDSTFTASCEFLQVEKTTEQNSDSVFDNCIRNSQKNLYDVSFTVLVNEKTITENTISSEEKSVDKHRTLSALSLPITLHESETPVLLRQSSNSVKSAHLRRSGVSRKTKLERRVSESDFTQYKNILRKNNINSQLNYPLPRKTHKNELSNSTGKLAKIRGNGNNAFPLLNTKIMEENIEEDGTVTLRDYVSSNRSRKYAETDRDSGVELENTKTLTRSTSHESGSEKGSVTEFDINLTPDSGINKTDQDVNNQFDFNTLTRSRSTDDILQNKPETDSTLTRRASLQDAGRTKIVDEKWDMCTLIKKFDLMEWDLSPAKNLKLETLDLDNCALESIPNTVPEIEYYALREVQAVSLNHNPKITSGEVLGKLPDLRAINMWGCNLEKIPPSWSTLTKVQMLGLGNNRNLIHFGPMKFLTNVIWLDLGGCGLKKIPDEVTHMMKLRVFALGGNPGIEIGDELCCMWDLKKLGLNDCQLTSIPQSVFSLQKLTHLHLDNNDIRTIGQEIVQLKDLEELTVTGNLEISFPKLLSQCETVKCIIVDEQKDLARISNTLRQRIKSQPAATSLLEQPVSDLT